jgi:hypothetical protein
MTLDNGAKGMKQIEMKEGRGIMTNHNRSRSKMSGKRGKIIKPTDRTKE